MVGAGDMMVATMINSLARQITEVNGKVGAHAVGADDGVVQLNVAIHTSDVTDFADVMIWLLGIADAKGLDIGRAIIDQLTAREADGPVDPHRTLGGVEV